MSNKLWLLFTSCDNLKAQVLRGETLSFYRGFATREFNPSGDEMEEVQPFFHKDGIDTKKYLYVESDASGGYLMTHPMF